MMNIPAPRAAARAAAVIGVSLAGAAWSQTFEFAIDPLASRLNANLGFDAQTEGSLIGSWSADSNPAGTRTKPGLFGEFGPAENVAVPVALGLSVAGDLETGAAGTFVLEIDTDAGALWLGSLRADLLADGPVTLPALVSVDPESFRTRAPDSVYLGASLELPVGEVAVSAMTLTFAGGRAPGVLDEVEPGRYAFAVGASAELHMSLALNQWPLEISAPIGLALAGEITISGSGATVTSTYRVDHAEWLEPGVALPQFPVELPTVLPPGGTAHLLMSLTLEELGSSLFGELTLAASACRADFDGDGAVNTVDVIAFLGAWSGREASADFDGDGLVDSRDVVGFLDAWAAGC